MKKAILFLIVSTLFCSCAPEKVMMQEDVMMITRKYVGQFLDHRYTPGRFVDPNTTWIKISYDSVLGKIPVCSKDCEFEKGDYLYVRKRFISLPGNPAGFWTYTLESSDQRTSYRLSTRKSGAGVSVEDY